MCLHLLICCFVVLLFCCFRHQECAFRNALGYYDVKNVEADVFFCFQNVMSHMVRTWFWRMLGFVWGVFFWQCCFRFNLSTISWRVIVRWVLLVGVLSVFNLKHISKHRHTFQRMNCSSRIWTTAPLGCKECWIGWWTRLNINIRSCTIIWSRSCNWTPNFMVRLVVGWCVVVWFGCCLLFVVVVGVVVVCSSCLYCSYCSYCSYIVRSVRIIRVYSHNFLTPSSFFFLPLIQACGGSLHCWPVNLTCRIVCGCGIPSLRTSTKRKLWNF